MGRGDRTAGPHFRRALLLRQIGCVLTRRKARDLRQLRHHGPRLGRGDGRAACAAAYGRRRRVACHHAGGVLRRLGQGRGDADRSSAVSRSSASTSSIRPSTAPTWCARSSPATPTARCETPPPSSTSPSCIDSGRVPNVAITSHKAQDTSPVDLVTLEARLADQGGGIGRAEWRINGITVGVVEQAAGAAGQPIALKQAMALDPGENTIELTAYNGANLVASVPARARITWTGSEPTAPPRLYVLVVGINDYLDAGLKLTYAVPDAKTLAAALQEAGQGHYEDVIVSQVLDRDATAAKLDQVFTDLAAKVRPRDVFLFFAAGHGKTAGRALLFHSARPALPHRPVARARRHRPGQAAGLVRPHPGQEGGADVRHLRGGVTHRAGEDPRRPRAEGGAGPPDPGDGPRHPHRLHRHAGGLRGPRRARRVHLRAARRAGARRHQQQRPRRAGRADPARRRPGAGHHREALGGEAVPADGRLRLEFPAGAPGGGAGARARATRSSFRSSPRT